MLATAFEALHPRAEAATADLGALAREIERFDPHMVVCSTPNTVDSGSRLAWVELSLDAAQPTKVCIDGRRSKTLRPTLDVLLALVDEVESLVQANGSPGCC